MRLKRFSSISETERAYAAEAMHEPLSGYLAGKPRGGKYVCMLEDEWQKTFHVKHAIACNSATSGLLAAAFAVGLGPGDRFLCPAMTMSATVAAPMFTGAKPLFCDVDPHYFALSPKEASTEVKAVFLTHLFGLGIDESWWRGWTRQNAIKLIIDAAQAPFATEDGKYAGTIGDIGVFSLNVHKPLQCGEGGVIVTQDDALAERMRGFINHSEAAGGPIGLNLRMPEISAAVALGQLWRAEEIMASRVEQAEAILDAIGDIPGLRRPVVRKDCTHVYYAIPFLTDVRERFCASLSAAGVPITLGYVPPLYRLPAFAAYARQCPIAESLHDERLFYIENCNWTFDKIAINQIGDAFKRAAEETWKS